MNPYDVVDPDELLKLRRVVDVQLTKGYMRSLRLHAHHSMGAVSVRGYLSEVLSLHFAAENMGLRLIGSRREVEDEAGREMIYGTVWYEIARPKPSLPDDLNLMKGEN